MTDENDSSATRSRSRRRLVLYVLGTLAVAAFVYVLSESAGGGVLANDLILDETLAIQTVSKSAVRQVNVDAETAKLLAAMVRTAKVIDSRTIGGRLSAFVYHFRRPLPIPTSPGDRQIEFKSESGRTYYVNVHDSTNDLMVYRSRPNLNLKVAKPATLFDQIAVCLLKDADAFRSLFDKTVADAGDRNYVPLTTVPAPQPTGSAK